MEAPSQTPDAPPLEDVHGTIQFARDLIARNDLRRAAKVLGQLVSENPNAEALLLLATIEIQRPATQPQALEHLRVATVRNPRYTEAWLMLANYWSLRGQPEKQRRCLERILSYDPQNRDAREVVDLLKGRD